MLSKKKFLPLAILILASGGAAAQTNAAPYPAPGPIEANEAYRDGRGDFDFLIGQWQVANRKLVNPLHHATVWEEFNAVNEARPLLDGLANLDEFRPQGWRPGFVGMSLRLFNPSTRQWSIFWVDNRSGTIGNPVTGHFTDGIGIFEGEDSVDHRAIRVRFVWNVQDRAHPRWEQAFSADGGNTWETNWIMRFSRPLDQSNHAEPAR